VYLSKEGQALLEKGVKKLGPIYVEVLRLHSVQELSVNEAAAVLEVPVGTVKARLHRARVKLTRYTQSMLKHKRRPMAARRQSVSAPISQVQ
jgi:DNA-directed RNA polymerase specialized sigma24 family protein